MIRYPSLFTHFTRFPSQMHITMIAAMDRNRVIGSRDGGIPWKLPRDQNRFRAFTEGKHLLVGRRTYQEMVGWFGSRIPVVLSFQREFPAPEGGLMAHSVDEAISETAERGGEELVVCGGAQVYEAALPYADELFLTRVDTESDGTILFPVFDKEIIWEKVSEEAFEADAANPFPMVFQRLRRVSPSSLRPARIHLS